MTATMFVLVSCGQDDSASFLEMFPKRPDAPNCERNEAPSIYILNSHPTRKIQFSVGRFHNDVKQGKNPVYTIEPGQSGFLGCSIWMDVNPPMAITYRVMSSEWD